MNIVIIQDDKVDVFKKWSEVSKYTSFKKEDFAQMGTDYTMNCTGDTFEVSKDIRLLEQVASNKVFTKDRMDTAGWMALGSLVLLLFVLMKLPSAQEIASTIIALQAQGGVMP